ncbi:hypothetical protein E4T49_07020 [Aureobasidium sp. EXF-10728]|nr:hypothetical protein E4T49_07020 [Aureobasidium sp. EXF-10728]
MLVDKKMLAKKLKALYKIIEHLDPHLFLSLDTRYCDDLKRPDHDIVELQVPEDVSRFIKVGEDMIEAQRHEAGIDRLLTTNEYLPQPCVYNPVKTLGDLRKLLKSGFVRKPKEAIAPYTHGWASRITWTISILTEARRVDNSNSLPVDSKAKFITPRKAFDVKKYMADLENGATTLRQIQVAANAIKLPEEHLADYVRVNGKLPEPKPGPGKCTYDPLPLAPKRKRDALSDSWSEKTLQHLLLYNAILRCALADARWVPCHQMFAGARLGVKAQYCCVLAARCETGGLGIELSENATDYYYRHGNGTTLGVDGDGNFERGRETALMRSPDFYVKQSKFSAGTAQPGDSTEQLMQQLHKETRDTMNSLHEDHLHRIGLVSGKVDHLANIEFRNQDISNATRNAVNHTFADTRKLRENVEAIFADSRKTRKDLENCKHREAVDVMAANYYLMRQSVDAIVTDKLQHPEAKKDKKASRTTWTASIDKEVRQSPSEIERLKEHTDVRVPISQRASQKLQSICDPRRVAEIEYIAIEIYLTILHVHTPLMDAQDPCGQFESLKTFAACAAHEKECRG